MPDIPEHVINELDEETSFTAENTTVDSTFEQKSSNVTKVKSSYWADNISNQAKFLSVIANQ